MLEDSVVLVTGGASGIGEAIGKKFLDEGAEVVVFDLEEPSYDAVFYRVDVRKESEVRSAIEEIDRLDFLVNNAGVYRHTPQDEYDSGDFEDLFDTNIRGYRMVFTYALPLLEESSEGSVLNISSALAQRPEPYSDIYCATKAAINALTTSWALSSNSVRANSVLPGPVETDMLEENFSEQELREYREIQLVEDFVDPEDVADLVFLIVTNPGFNGEQASIGGEAFNNQYGV